MDSSKMSHSSFRDRVDYTSAFHDVISQSEYACGGLGLNICKGVGLHKLIKPYDFTSLVGPDTYSLTSSSEVDWYSASSHSVETLAPQVSHRKPWDFTSLKGPGAYSLGTSRSNEEWCSVSSHSVGTIAHHVRLHKPWEFISLKGPDAYSLVTSSSEENWCSASSHSVETIARHTCLLKPCEFISLKGPDAYSLVTSSSEEDWCSAYSQLNHSVCLLRPCDIGLNTSENSFSESACEQGSISVLRPLLRPKDITNSRSSNSSAPLYIEPNLSLVLSQTNIPLPRQLHLVRPCDIIDSLGIYSQAVTSSSGRPTTSLYSSASTHLPVSLHDSDYSSITASSGHDEWRVYNEVSPLPMGYLHRTTSYSCRSLGSLDQSTSWISSVSSNFSTVDRYPDLLDETLASISVPNTPSTVRYLDDLTSWNQSTPGYELGRGVHGAVHLYKHKQTGQPVAVKVLTLPKDHIKRIASISHFKKEVQFQELVSKSPYYPALYGYIRHDVDRVGLAMEFVGDEVTGKSTTLYKALEVGQPALTRQQMLLIAVDVVEGLSVLHDKDILINDLKNDNILIRKEFGKWRGVLIDLGQACTIKQPISYHFSQREKQDYLTIGRYGHIAPELALSKQSATLASDVFQVGAVLIELGQAFNINELHQLGCICCSIAPSQRPSLDEIRECLGAIMQKYYYY